MFVIESLKQIKMYLFWGQKDDCCLLTIYPAELKSHSQGTCCICAQHSFNQQR